MSKWVKCNVCKNEWSVADNEEIEHWDECEICGENWWIEEINGVYSDSKEALYKYQNQVKERARRTP